MAKYESGLSNRSYTNKDFNAIYPELLDLVKKLSPKWDPSVSDESDPGNILLKLAAIVADKNNYTIDKGVLETFPISVAQESNARELFAQLGYFMNWYRAATGTVNLRWIGDAEYETDYNIPAFTMISDLENNYVYTITEKVSLRNNGTEVQANIIQGTFVNHSINSKELITIANLDSNNRIYLPRSNVAENGIFICNASNEAEKRGNYGDWRRVDNLEVESYGQYVYKFGVTPDGYSCYIEFPADAEDIFADGIYISYILTDGSNGNITRKVLEQFYEDTKASFRDEEGNTDEISLSTEKVALLNLNPIQNGLDPESIDQAYTNFKKTIGTFNTLVSIQDYSNAIRQCGLVSNGFVTDRNTDVQSSYKIITNNNGIEERVFYVESVQEKPEQEAINGEYLRIAYGYLENNTFYKDVNKTIRLDPDPTMIYLVFIPNTGTAGLGITKAYIYRDGQYQELINTNYLNVRDLDEYTLKVYVLQKVDNIQNSIGYDRSFEVVPYVKDSLADNNENINIEHATISNILDYISENKSIIHDFKGQRPFKPVLFINKYPIKCKVIPQYKLTTAQQNDIFNNIITTLFNKLNSKEVAFGESIEYDKVFDMIVQADERIKAIALDTLSYETYAIYYDTTLEKYQEINISNKDLYIECYAKVIDSKIRIYRDSEFIEEIRPEKDFYYLDILTNNIYIYDATLPGCVYKCPDMRFDIFAKSVLAGVSQLLIPANNYNYSLEQNYKAQVSNVDKITTNAICNVFEGFINQRGNINNINAGYTLNKPVIPGSLKITLSDGAILNDDGKGDVYKNGIDVGTIEYKTGRLEITNSVSPAQAVIDYQNVNGVANEQELIEYSVKENENIYLTAPSLIQTASYSTYTKYQFQLVGGTADNPKIIKADSEYQLKSGESITFFWKSKDDDDAPYEYYKYAEGTIISPSFNISSVKNTSDNDYCGKSLAVGKGKVSDPTTHVRVSQLIDSDVVLSGSRTIYIKDINKVVINENNKTEYCCWILNKKQIIDGIEKYELFPANVKEYTLQSNEYFIYNIDNGARLIVLGTGTKISREGGTLDRWTCNIVDPELLMDSSRSNELNNLWVPTQLNTTVIATEMQYITIGAGEKIKFINNTPNHVYYISFNNEGYDILASTRMDIIEEPDPKMSLADFYISYTNNGTEVEVPTIDLYDSDNEQQGWFARSIYRIDVNDTRPQVLYSGQSIQYHNIDEEENIIFGDDQNPINVLSNNDTILGGGIDISTVGTSLMNENTYLDFYQYTSGQNPRENISYDQNQIIVNFNRLSDEGPIKKAAFTFKLPEGEYIIPFINQASDLTNCEVDYVFSEPRDEIKTFSLTLTLTNTPIPGTLNILVDNHTLLDDGLGNIMEQDIKWGTLTGNQINFTNASDILPAQTSTIITYETLVAGAVNNSLSCIGRQLNNFITPHYYYLYFKSEGRQVTLTLSVKYKDDIYGFKRFIFKTIYKYNHIDENILNDREFNLVLDKMIELDKNIEYDFTYQVSPEVLISNPLEGEAFLDNNHIFNNNTICKIDVINTDLQITNKIK